MVITSELQMRTRQMQYLFAHHNSLSTSIHDSYLYGKRVIGVACSANYGAEF